MKEDEYRKAKMKATLHPNFLPGTDFELIWYDNPAHVQVYAYEHNTLKRVMFGLNASFGNARIHREGIFTAKDAARVGVDWVQGQARNHVDRIEEMYMEMIGLTP